MADEDDRELQEALRRSLEQTNLQESQLADALAESVRTRDHEIAQGFHRNELVQIERDLMTPTISDLENSIRSIEADLLSSQTSFETSNGKWQVVGELRGGRQRYNPIETGEEQKTDALRCSSQADTANSTSSESTAVAILSNAALRRVSHGCVREPYRPPNSHLPFSSTGLRGDEGPASIAQTTTNEIKTEHEVVAMPAVLPYRRLDAQNTTSKKGHAASETDEPLVVIDGQNVGCSYGGGGVSRFRAKGVEAVLDFYFNQGIPAVAVVPRHKVDTRSNIVNDRLADDPDLLRTLEDQGRLAFTPAGAHDDHFLLRYAMSKDIDIISNDRFQREIWEQETHVDARKLRSFLDRHLIPYTFIHGQFVPNPKQTQLGRSIHHSRNRS